MVCLKWGQNVDLLLLSIFQLKLHLPLNDSYPYDYTLSIHSSDTIFRNQNKCNGILKTAVSVGFRLFVDTFHLHYQGIDIMCTVFTHFIFLCSTLIFYTLLLLKVCT